METHEQDFHLKAILANLPEIRLTCVPPVGARNDRIRILIQTATLLRSTDDLTLQLVSSQEGNPYTIEMEVDGNVIDFTVPKELPDGEYYLQIKRADWILDSVPFEVADEEYARAASSFAKGLQLRVEALNEVGGGHYERAVELAHEVERYYGAASSTDIAAHAWQDLGSALLQANQSYLAQEAFDRAYGLYTTINDSEGQASSLFLLGQTYSRDYEVKDALIIFDRARTIADSCSADYVALKSRAALWHLSSGGAESLRRQYGRDLIYFSCGAKSPRTRNEAIILYSELVPLALLNNLWSFDNNYILSHNMNFECTFSPHLFGSQHRSLPSFRDWKDDVTTPWEGMLAVFTSTLLTKVVLSISEFILQANKAVVELRVQTRRDRSRECFYVSFARPSQIEIFAETIQKYLSFDNDFKYYEALAKVAGASLIGSTDQPNFIQMIMPLGPHIVGETEVGTITEEPAGA